MEKQRLSLDSLQVDSFRTGTDETTLAAQANPNDTMFVIGMECTGCMSGCGIFANA